MAEIHNPKPRPEPTGPAFVSNGDGSFSVAMPNPHMRVMTFEPTPESLDMLIYGLQRSIEIGCATPDAGVTLLLAELLRQALRDKAT